MAMLASTKSVAVVKPSRRSVCVKASSWSFDKCYIAVATTAAVAGLSAAPAFADGVKFSNVSDGSKVSSPVHLEFQVEGLAVKPAADGLVSGTGHFHVLIDEPLPEEGEGIPFDASHKHYGKGQNSDDIDLPPGKHTLSLVFANAQHISYGPSFSQKIYIDVSK
ncbi:hypothetical protein CEUSTIGMA_g1750.t1 [Chlamydomonas eustigma]|uniref:DUF4399 domain-containing protein n=1 Tax=Chlamydomonas eustigma TaxID=1157962 RepID=A0A250WU11_9CHLO|nr:hypothetical protein CEUSTIGMA_g1750.t1 [Chlamydomonas eustigma]|eukprot:GAX74301.1 hypothetical protein CEUSTIGMA_g1750.t1 [Chlamydomonas eustigma]